MTTYTLQSGDRFPPDGVDYFFEGGDLLIQSTNIGDEGRFTLFIQNNSHLQGETLEPYTTFFLLIRRGQGFFVINDGKTAIDVSLT